MRDGKSANTFSIAERMATGGILSIEEFCAWSGIGRGRTYKEIKEGSLRVVKIGRRTGIRAENAKEWAAALGAEVA